MSEFFKEVAKALMIFANLFSILVFFTDKDWIGGILVIISIYTFSALVYLLAIILKEEQKNE